jgi:biopolymer transport protein ExbD
MKKTRRMGGDDELNITSMMDMMTIILVFLLKSVGASEVEVRTSDQLKLPYSTNKAPPLLTVSVVVQKDSILVDGAEVASVISETNPNLSNVRTYAVPKDEKTGLSINRLFDELNDKKEVSKVLESKTKGQIKFEGKMVLQFDQNIPYSLIREVMFTAGKAEFFDFQFVLIQK